MSLVGMEAVIAITKWDDKVVCPHCGAENYRFYQDQVTFRKRCFKCKEFLYSKEEWEEL